MLSNEVEKENQNESMCFLLAKQTSIGVCLQCLHRQLQIYTESSISAVLHRISEHWVNPI
jgi:hypothetical protein